MYVRVSVFWGFYAQSNCSFVETFRDNLSIPSSRVKKSQKSLIGSKDVGLPFSQVCTLISSLDFVCFIAFFLFDRWLDARDVLVACEKIHTKF